MGGGDLNLKKSWHPSTIKNQEKVWQAEQARAHEDKKIAELAHELREEREKEQLQKSVRNATDKSETSNKLDWMYKGPAGHVSREEYLLGRKVDASLDILNREEDPNKQDEPPKSSHVIEYEIVPDCFVRRRPEDQDPTATVVQVDMKHKLLEDPLLAIRKQEELTRREITSNPVKRKQLQLLINSIRDCNNSSSGDSDSDKPKNRKKKTKNKKKSKSKKQKKEKKKKSKKKSKKHKSKHDSDSSSSSSSSSDDEEPTKKRHKSRDKTDTKRFKSDAYEELSTKRTESRRYSDNKPNSMRNISPHRRSNNKDRSPHANTSKAKGSHDDRHDHRSDQYGRRDEYGPNRQHQRHNTQQSKLSEEEMRERRGQMMKSAVARDEERTGTVKQYQDDRKKEQDIEDHANRFIRPHLAAATVGSSVEERVKSRAGVRQRDGDSMSTNFARK